MKITNWHKSSYSTGAQQNCVEVGGAPGVVGVRDTKARERGHLTVTRKSWASFVRSL